MVRALMPIAEFIQQITWPSTESTLNPKKLSQPFDFENKKMKETGGG